MALGSCACAGAAATAGAHACGNTQLQQEAGLIIAVADRLCGVKHTLRVAEPLAQTASAYEGRHWCSILQ